MTTSIRLTLSVDGDQLEGEGDGGPGADYIDCLAFTDGVTTDQAPTGRSLGRRHFEPVVLRKRIDRTSPQLLDALTQNQPVGATFRFFRPSADGTEEHYFTVEIPSGRIITIERSWSNDDPHEAEDVGIAPQAIVWTDVPTGITTESRPRTV